MHDTRLIALDPLSPLGARLAKFTSRPIEIIHCVLWGKPYLAAARGLGGGYVDFSGRPHATDVIGEGKTEEEAIEALVVSFGNR